MPERRIKGHRKSHVRKMDLTKLLLDHGLLLHVKGNLEKGEKKTLELQPNPVMLIIASLGPSAHRAHQWVLLQQA